VGVAVLQPGHQLHAQPPELLVVLHLLRPRKHLLADRRPIDSLQLEAGIVFAEFLEQGDERFVVAWLSVFGMLGGLDCL